MVWVCFFFFAKELVSKNLQCPLRSQLTGYCMTPYPQPKHKKLSRGWTFQLINDLNHSTKARKEWLTKKHIKITEPVCRPQSYRKSVGGTKACQVADKRRKGLKEFLDKGLGQNLSVTLLFLFFLSGLQQAFS